MRVMIPVSIFWDDEAQVWVAVSEGIGLALESESYDTLIQRMQIAVPEMAAENNVICTGINFTTQNRQVVL